MKPSLVKFSSLSLQSTWILLHESFVSLLLYPLFIFTACESGDFPCDNGKCIPEGYVCNYVNDCGDFSDEPKFCCGPDKFKCANSECISMTYRCNCYEDCSDASDEENCDMTCSWKLLLHLIYLFNSEFKQ